MRVGSVGGYISSPYIYNTNTVSKASLNKIQPIEDDLLESKTDFSKLASENTNPLAVGQTSDYQGLVDMQMQIGQMNAVRLFA